MRNLIFLITFFLVSFSIFTQPVAALSCLPPPEPEQAFQEADAVILAQTTQVTNQGHTAQLHILEQYKPDQALPTSVSITTDLTWGLTFETGQQYLLYSYFDDQQPPNLIVPLCSRSHFGGDLVTTDLPVVQQLASSVITPEATDSPTLEPVQPVPQQPETVPPTQVVKKQIPLSVWAISLGITAVGIGLAAYYLPKMNSTPKENQ